MLPAGLLLAVLAHSAAAATAAIAEAAAAPRATSAVSTVPGGTRDLNQGSTFKCLDGTAEVPFHALNDNFCDCPDASDEPGTAACSGLPGARFFCENRDSIARFIYASRVGDGICDCCDGSDEVEVGTLRCPNTCTVEGVEAKASVEERLVAIRRGLALRSELENNAEALLATWHAQKDIIDKQVAELEQAKTTGARTVSSRADGVIAGDRAVGAIVASGVYPKETPAYGSEVLLAEDFEAPEAIDRWATELGTGSSYIVQDPKGLRGRVLAFEGCTVHGNGFSLQEFSCSTGSRCEISFWARGAPWQGFARGWAHSWLAVPSSYGGLSARTISTRSSDEWVQYRYTFPSNDLFQAFGSDDVTFSTGPVRLMVQAHEATGKCQETMFDSFQVQRVHQQDKATVLHAMLERARVSEYARWALARDEQAGSEFKSGSGSRRPDESYAAATGPPQIQVAARGLGRRAAPREQDWQPDDATRGLRQIRGRRFSLEQKIRHWDLAPESARWASLIDHCLDERLQHHSYKICYYGTAKQGSASLGTFQRWDFGGPQPTLVYEGGQRCPSGPPRNLKLRLVCGSQEKLLDMRETSRCTYEAEASHPSACSTEDLALAEARAAGAPLLPHEEL